MGKDTFIQKNTEVTTVASLKGKCKNTITSD